MEASVSEIKTIDIDGGLHEIGNKDCQEGWCSTDYPKPCECGGLIHAEFGDEDFDCNFTLFTKCDKCGESE